MREHGEAKSFIVLSDIHANAGALRRGLAIADEHPESQLVLLGDLLTYGCDIQEVIDLVADAQSRRGAWLFRGNHDQLYFDLAQDKRAYYERLSDWIRESADYTMERLDVALFRDGLTWRDETVTDGLLFSHANPFGRGDWRYLNTKEEHAAAADKLQARGLRGGVFGHTHRAKVITRSHGTMRERDTGKTISMARDEAAVVIANPGSLGQPRGATHASTLMRIAWSDASASFDCVPVDYDIAAHLRALERAPFSRGTKARLASYFEEAILRGAPP
jgi:predicted phosphodiesterase